jgi:dTDP-4-dehydrorhamnose 3,5-epimerase-like enzyme
MVEVRELGLAGVYEITPRRFTDHRSFFSEMYNALGLAATGIWLRRPIADAPNLSDIREYTAHMK